MISDAALEHLGEVFADEEFLFGAQLKRIWRWQLPGEIGGHCFGGLASRSENQNRSKVFGERLGDEARPIAANFARNMKIQVISVDFFERHRAFIMPDQNGL